MRKIRQRGRHRVEVNEFNSASACSARPAAAIPVASGTEAVAVAKCFNPVGDSRVLVGDDDAHLAVRVRLGLRVIERGRG